MPAPKIADRVTGEMRTSGILAARAGAAGTSYRDITVEHGPVDLLKGRFFLRPTRRHATQV